MTRKYEKRKTTRDYIINPKKNIKYKGENVTPNFIEGVKYHFNVDINQENVEYWMKKIVENSPNYS